MKLELNFKVKGVALLPVFTVSQFFFLSKHITISNNQPIFYEKRFW